MSAGTFSRTVNYDAQQPLTKNSALVQTILSELDSFDLVVPLIFFRFEKISVVNYEYELFTVDGRRWLQDIEIQPSTDANYGFDRVQGRWKLSQFQRQRILRDSIVKMVETYGLTLFRVDYS